MTAPAARAVPAFPVRLAGPRVVLRDFEAGDLDGSMSIVGDPEVTVWLSFDTRTREEQAEVLAADIARARADPRPDYYLAITARSDETDLIGFIRLGLGAHRSAELGFALRRSCWGLGYASEASRIMLGFGFGTLGLHRIQAAAGPDNTASHAVLDSLGFTYEGRIRDHVHTNGTWRDSLLYSLLEEEWRTGPAESLGA